MLAVFEITQEEPKHYQSPKDDKDLVARVAAVEKDVRGDQKERTSRQRANPAEIAAPGKEREGDDADAKQGGWNAGGKVRVAKQKIR